MGIKITREIPEKNYNEPSKPTGLFYNVPTDLYEIKMNIKTCLDNQKILNDKIEYLTNLILSMKGQQ